MRPLVPTLAAAALLLPWAAARAQSGPSRVAALLEDGARAFAAAASVPAAPLQVPPAPPAPAPVPVEPVSAGVNYSYADMVDRMEKLRGIVIGRKRRKRTVSTGVTPADRIDRGEIRYIVLHASGGATGAPGACEASVAWLLKRPTAAHFMVCRDGRVFRMVAIENIANQVKNKEVDRAAIGIETESGHPEAGKEFVSSDWDPDLYWRMYASMAWLIRALAQETGLPRDRGHVITHAEADRGIPRAHVDPGPYFDAQTYPAFDQRFPGESVTPREFLMRLVADDDPPRLWLSADGTAVEAKDADRLGVAHLSVYRVDAAGKLGPLVSDWSPSPLGLPPTAMSMSLPDEPGAYRVVARDLVGNTVSGVVHMPPAPPAATARPQMPSSNSTP